MATAHPILFGNIVYAPGLGVVSRSFVRKPYLIERTNALCELRVILKVFSWGMVIPNMYQGE